MKTYTLIVDHPRRGTKEVTGTLEYLTSYFGYTLEIGHSRKASIKTKPKTIKSLVSNLQRALEVKEGRCYERTYVSLKKPLR